MEGPDRPRLTCASRRPLRSSLHNTSCAVLQQFIPRQSHIPLSPAQIGGATYVWAPHSDPQPPSTSDVRLTKTFLMMGRPFRHTNRPHMRPTTVVNIWARFKHALQQHFSCHSGIPKASDQAAAHLDSRRRSRRCDRGISANASVNAARRLWSRFSASGTSQPIPHRCTRLRRGLSHTRGALTHDDEEVATFDLRSRSDRDSGDGAGRGRGDGCFHLHRLDARN